MAAFIEFFPLLVFFGFYKFYDMYWASGALIVAMAIVLIFNYFTNGKIEKKHWVFFGVTLVFGGLTIGLRDETFIMWKPTVIYLIFAIALLSSQAIFKKPALKALLGEVLKVEDKVWKKAGWFWALFFVLSGLLNLYIAFNFSQDIWVNFKVFGMTIATFVVTIVTIAYLYQSMSEEDKKALAESEEKPEKTTKSTTQENE